jgi:hypothetical protein
MALGSTFGRRTDDDEARDDRTTDYSDRTVDRDRDGVDDRVQDGDRDTFVSERHPTTTTDPETTERVPAEPVPTAPVTTTPPGPFGGRTSMMATLGLIFGVIATLTALTGLLAPIAVAAGALGLLFCLGGVSASGRRAVTGRGVAMLGLLGSLAGIVLGVVAMTDMVSWLDSDVDQVARFHDWLDAQFPFLQDW